jgi:hypothetical protein
MYYVGNPGHGCRLKSKINPNASRKVIMVIMKYLKTIFTETSKMIETKNHMVLY